MKVIILFLLLIGSNAINAQIVDMNSSTSNGSNIELQRVVDLYVSKNKKNNEETGFRVQLAISNDKNKLIEMRKLFVEKFPNMEVYLEYKQPYFKLRAGDFRDRVSAYGLLAKVKEFFPQSFVVNDNINLIIKPRDEDVDDYKVDE